MSTKAKAALAGAGVVVVAGATFFVLSARGSGPLGVLAPPECPLTGVESTDEKVDRPAVAVKVENAEVAYPLSGLEKADVVYEELVEGGITRFMAIYHCGEARKVGPVRSARAVDPSIMIPLTRILAYSGSNQHVRRALDEAEVVQLDETRAGNGLRRIERAGISGEHTLYANVPALRRRGARDFDDAPPDDIFGFGDLGESGSKRARSITIEFSAATTVTYDFRRGRWRRSQNGEPFMSENGRQIAVDNVLIEVHEVRLSEITDVAGNRSIEIADETGSGPAVLFRDGRAIEGEWTRESVEDGVSFTTRNGEDMVFAPGSIWIELLPNETGEVKGSFSYGR